MPGYKPNQSGTIVDLCHKKQDFGPKNPEEDPACRLPDLYRVWKRRRNDAIKPGCWDDPQECLYHPWDAKSPYLEQEEISMIFRSNVFPGYTYTGKRFSTYDAFFNANVFNRRSESSIPDKFRKRNTDFTTWIQKMIQDKVLMKSKTAQKDTTALQQKSQSFAKSALDLPAKSNYYNKGNMTSALIEKPKFDKSMEKTNVETLVVGEMPNTVKTSILKQNLETPSLTNTSIIKPDIEKPNLETPSLTNTSIIKPDIEKPNLETPSTAHTSIIKPDIENTSPAKTSTEKPDIAMTSIIMPSLEKTNPEKSTLDTSTLEKSTEKVILKKSTDIKARESNVVKIVSEKY